MKFSSPAISILCFVTTTTLVPFVVQGQQNNDAETQMMAAPTTVVVVDDPNLVGPVYNCYSKTDPPVLCGEYDSKCCGGYETSSSFNDTNTVSEIDGETTAIILASTGSISSASSAASTSSLSTIIVTTATAAATVVVAVGIQEVVGWL